MLLSESSLARLTLDIIARWFTLDISFSRAHSSACGFSFIFADLSSFTILSILVTQRPSRELIISSRDNYSRESVAIPSEHVCPVVPRSHRAAALQRRGPRTRPPVQVPRHRRQRRGRLRAPRGRPGYPRQESLR